MSEENVEIVRRIYAEWAQGNMRAGVDRFDPEIRFESFIPDANERVVANGPALLDPPTQGAHPQQLPLAHRAR